MFRRRQYIEDQLKCYSVKTMLEPFRVDYGSVHPSHDGLVIYKMIHNSVLIGSDYDPGNATYLPRLPDRGKSVVVFLLCFLIRLSHIQLPMYTTYKDTYRQRIYDSIMALGLHELSVPGRAPRRDISDSINSMAAYEKLLTVYFMCIVSFSMWNFFKTASEDRAYSIVCDPNERTVSERTCAMYLSFITFSFSQITEILVDEVLVDATANAMYDSLIRNGGVGFGLNLDSILSVNYTRPPRQGGLLIAHLREFIDNVFSNNGKTLQYPSIPDFPQWTKKVYQRILHELINGRYNDNKRLRDTYQHDFRLYTGTIFTRLRHADWTQAWKRVIEGATTFTRHIEENPRVPRLERAKSRTFAAPEWDDDDIPPPPPPEDLSFGDFYFY